MPLPGKEGEDESDENRPLVLNDKITPLSIINIQASDEYLIQKLQTLPEKELKNTHFNENDMIRRLKIFRKTNNCDNGQPVLLNFFTEQKIDVLNINLEGLDPKTHFNMIQAFIERKGKFRNYQISEELEERKRVELQGRVYKEKMEKQKVLYNKMEEKEKEQRLLAEEEYQLKLEDFRKEEKNILDSKSFPLRFIIAFIISFNLFKRIS